MTISPFKDYTVVCNQSLQKLIESVNELIELGYEPYQRLICEADANGKMYFQAMIERKTRAEVFDESERESEKKCCERKGHSVDQNGFCNLGCC